MFIVSFHAYFWVCSTEHQNSWNSLISIGQVFCVNIFLIRSFLAMLVVKILPIAKGNSIHPEPIGRAGLFLANSYNKYNDMMTSVCNSDVHVVA